MRWTKQEQSAIRLAMIRGQMAQFACDPSITLAAIDATVADSEGPAWLHVATEGTYNGHSNKFTLDQSVFNELISNLHKDPRFELGDDGFGAKDVLPFDYEHASEMPGFAVSKDGAPSMGWVLDLKAETGSDGKLRLYALTNLGDKIKDQIRNNEYKFTSIAFHPNSKDRLTGESIGMLMTSIAFTNTPFIQDLEPIAASAQMALSSDNLGWFDAASSPEDALSSLRRLLKVPLSTTPAEVFALAETLLTAPPEGTELEDVTSAYRSIFNLGPASDSSAILVELGKVRDQLLQTTVDSTVAPVETPPTGADLQALTSGENTTMALSTLGTKLAALLQGKKITLSAIKLFADDEDVVKAVDEVADGAVKSAGTVNDVLAALGVEDAAGAMASIATLQDAKTKLTAALSELEAALAQGAAMETQQAEADVTAALTAKSFDISAKDAVTAHRATLCAYSAEAFKADNKKTRTVQLSEGREKFLTHYGVPKEEHRTLLSMVATGPAGTDDSISGRAKDEQTGIDSANIPEGATVIKLTAAHKLEARRTLGDSNNTLAAVIALSATDESFAGMKFQDKIRDISARVRENTLVIQEIQA